MSTNGTTRNAATTLSPVRLHSIVVYFSYVGLAPISLSRLPLITHILTDMNGGMTAYCFIRRRVDAFFADSGIWIAEIVNIFQ